MFVRIVLWCGEQAGFVCVVSLCVAHRVQARAQLHMLPLGAGFRAGLAAGCGIGAPRVHKPVLGQGGGGALFGSGHQRQVMEFGGLSLGLVVGERESNGRFSLTECPRLRHFQP